ncbi:hypothetical protein MHH52_09920 [Paenibacillus sp. FSL K6-0276]|uniref:hypothetical protein n=1 Tax=Paenibacillus sp. FSL K6-0276 TaxID=2921450 RepID=UPI0030EEC8AC
MKMQNSKLLYYLVWIIVGALLLHYGNSLISHYTEEAKKNYQLESTVWMMAIVPFFYGMYLALLEGLPKAFVVNWPLLFIVFLPSFLLLIYPILMMYFNLSNIVIYKFATLHDGIVFGLVSGIALVKSLTSKR